MFRKLLRYDLRAVMPTFKMQAFITLLLSVPFGLVWRTLDSGVLDNLDVYEGLAVTFMFLMFVWLFVSYFVVQISFFSYTKKNFFTDEGYLTFTLPVTRKDLLLSKTVSSLYLGVLQAFVYIATLAIVLLLAPVPEKGIITLDGYRTLFRGIVDVWQSLGAWLFVYVLEIILLYICFQFLFTSIVLWCDTFAATYKKKVKGASAVFIGLLFYFVLNNFFGIAWISMAGGYANPVNLLMLISEIAERLTGTIAHSGWALLLLIACIAQTCFGCTLFCSTLDRLERKLNLT